MRVYCSLLTFDAVDFDNAVRWHAAPLFLLSNFYMFFFEKLQVVLVYFFFFSVVIDIVLRAVGTFVTIFLL